MGFGLVLLEELENSCLKCLFSTVWMIMVTTDNSWRAIRLFSWVTLFVVEENLCDKWYIDTCIRAICFSYQPTNGARAPKGCILYVYKDNLFINGILFCYRSGIIGASLEVLLKLATDLATDNEQFIKWWWVNRMYGAEHLLRRFCDRIVSIRQANSASYPHWDGRWVLAKV